MMKKILYIITNISMPDICKVGMTDNLEKRLKDLNKTGLPTKFQVYESFSLPNVDILEQQILQHFGNVRINRKREFLKIHPERICDYIQDNKNIVPEKEKDIGNKFQKLGLQQGDILKFKEGNEIYNDIIAEIGPGNSIMFQGKKTSLSKSAQIILKNTFDKHRKAVQGTLYRTHNSQSIRELMDSKNL